MNYIQQNQRRLKLFSDHCIKIIFKCLIVFCFVLSLFIKFLEYFMRFNSENNDKQYISLTYSDAVHLLVLVCSLSNEH